jgi:hypothetical protein
VKAFFKSSSELSYSRQSQQTYHEQLKLSLSKQGDSGRQVFSKSIEFSLGIKTESTYEFKVPSPKDVAATVLGFVESRINAEKAAGASTEKLNDLMAQAKSGIEKGYGQAKKDIEDLGLMTEQLSKDIAEGFDLINVGLEKIKQDINNPNSTKEINQQADSSEQASFDNNVPSKDNAVSSNLFDQGKNITGDEVSGQKFDVASANAMSIRQLSENTADFVLNTQEGDQILIRMSDLEQSSYAKNSSSEEASLAKSFKFEFSVKGDVNEKELEAINDLLEQVDTISSLFFSEQFEAAFSSALDLGFDAEQIASFSLDLSKLQVQEVRVYEESSKDVLGTYKRNQPLINMAQQFERLGSLLQPLERFEELNSMIDALVSKAIDRYSLKERQEDVSFDSRIEHFQEFSQKLIDSVLIQKD